MVQGSAADLLCACIRLISNALLPAARQLATVSIVETPAARSQGLGASISMLHERIWRKVKALSRDSIAILSETELVMSIHDEIVLDMPTEARSTQTPRSSSSPIPASPARQAMDAVCSVMTEEAPMLVAACGDAHILALRRAAMLIAFRAEATTHRAGKK